MDTPISENELWLLSFYRTSELSGALFFGRLARALRAGPIQRDLTRHFADESQHAWYWTRCIAELGGQKVETKEEGDKRVITFFDGDQPYIVIVTLCEVKPGKCLGVVELALVNTSPNDISLEQLNKLNADNIYLSGFKVDTNKFGYNIGAGAMAFFNQSVGVRGDVRYFHAAESMGSSRWDIFRRIILPGTLPSIVVGSAVGMGITWEVVVAAEMISGGGASGTIGSGGGLGFFIWNSYVGGSYEQIVVGMISIGIAGFASSELLRWLGRYATPWLKAR